MAEEEKEKYKEFIPGSSEDNWEKWIKKHLNEYLNGRLRVAGYFFLYLGRDDSQTFVNVIH